MNPLALVLPWWWRWAAIAALAVACVAFGWFKGSEHWHGVLIEAQAEAMTKTVKIASAREHITTVVETKYLPQAAKQQVVTETIYKEVPTYVPQTDPPLSAGFRVLHDAAALGLVPDPASKRDAAAVAAQDAARTITENYGICRKDQLSLSELQDWILQQQKLRTDKLK